MSTLPAKRRSIRRRVSFVIFPDVKLLDLTGALQVFADANEVLGFEAYSTVIGSLYGGPVDTDTGVALNSRRMAGIGADENDTLLVCGGRGVFVAAENARFVEVIRQNAAKSGRIASTCTGAFLLARTGMLDGHRVVTHWAECDALADKHPEIQVDPDPVYIEDGKVWTSGGGTACIDLALAMVEQDHGPDTAKALARNLLVFMNRQGGQAQFSTLQTPAALPEPDMPRPRAGRFDALHLWMRDNLTADMRVEALAARCGMSPRNFARLYAQETGQTPARMVDKFRLEAAKARLEDTTDTIRSISDDCGYGNLERLRRSFLRHFGVSPQAYRDRFATSQRTNPHTDDVASLTD